MQFLYLNPVLEFLLEELSSEQSKRRVAVRVRVPFVGGYDLSVCPEHSLAGMPLRLLIEGLQDVS